MSDRYTAANLDPKTLHIEGLHRDLGSTLIIAPHPDDETLGCGGLILHLRQQDSPVTIVFITDGSASHPNSKEYSSNRIKELRKQEAINACQELNVYKKQLYFLEIPDNCPELHSVQKTKEIENRLKGVIRQHQCATIVTPWRRDAHIDHRYATKIVRNVVATLLKPPIVVEYPIWLWKNGEKQDWPLRNEIFPFQLNISEFVNQKRKALHCHKSQLGEIVRDDPKGFVLTEELRAFFLHSKEIFFFPINFTKSSLSKSYFQKLYDQSDDPWNFKDSLYEQQKYNKTIEIIKSLSISTILELGCSIGVLTGALAPYVKHIQAIDINQKAIVAAKELTQNFNNITFDCHDFNTNFIYGIFDLVLLSEIGYYCNKTDLKLLFERCEKSLNTQGYIMLIHWTGYVRDYPLTGFQVHQFFNELYVQTGLFSVITLHQESMYELLVCQLNSRTIR